MVSKAPSPRNTSLAINFITILIIVVGCISFIAPPKKGSLKISFVNTANGKNVVLRDSFYTNGFGEQYNISKLKYYISNIIIKGNKNWIDKDGYYLMNAAAEETIIQLDLPAGNYNDLQFLLGVDSARNCSGAQTGALDPLNDMFWTWNTGYVMFKLEGTSASSKADLQRLEYHVGGYKGDNNVATTIQLKDPSGKHINITDGKTTEIIIETNLDHFWHGNNDVRIAEDAVCMTTGRLAKKIASNFNTLFSIRSIQELP